MTLRSETLTQAADLDSLRAAWDELLADSATNEPTLSFDWQAAWWEVFGLTDGRSLLVLLWYDGPRLVGLLPLQRRRVRYSGVVPFARLEILASGEDEEDEICSEYLNPVLRRGYEERLAPEIAAALSRRNDWDEIVLPSLDGSQPVASLLKSAFEQQGYRTECEETNACPYVPLPDTWAAYLAALPSQRRYLITRSLRDVEEWARGKQALRRAASRDELRKAAPFWPASTASAGSNAVAAASSPPAVSSVSRADDAQAARPRRARSLAARGGPQARRRGLQLRLGQQGPLLPERTGDGPPKKVRIGIVAHALVMQRAIVEGRREYDFLAGTTQYKMQMALSTRPLWRLRVVRSESRERLRLGMERPRRIARAPAGRFSARWSGLLPLPKAVGRADGER